MTPEGAEDGNVSNYLASTFVFGVAGDGLGIGLGVGVTPNPKP